MTKDSLIAEIKKLKKDKNAVILAHYYQNEEIQSIADYTGDSLGLSQQAAKTNASIIVFCGVHFMAETAKIINPNIKVVLPDLDAGCSLEASCPPIEFKTFLDKHTDYKVITYINCSAEIKTMSDIVCTSSNAIKVINSFPKNQKIIFAPDKNLGKYLNEQTGRKMILWDGACIVHEAFSIEKLLSLHKKYPKARIIAHPESESHILEVASFVGSTTQLIDYVTTNSDLEFIVATEAGVLYKMRELNPNTRLIPAPIYDNNSCSCSECSFMKVNTLEKLRNCLRDELPEIIIDSNILEKAAEPIFKMLKIK